MGADRCLLGLSDDGQWLLCGYILGWMTFSIKYDVCLKQHQVLKNFLLSNRKSNKKQWRLFHKHNADKTFIDNRIFVWSWQCYYKLGELWCRSRQAKLWHVFLLNLTLERHRSANLKFNRNLPYAGDLMSLNVASASSSVTNCRKGLVNLG